MTCKFQFVIFALILLLGFTLADTCATIDGSVDCGASTCELTYSACVDECFQISTCSGSSHLYGKFSSITESQATGTVFSDSACSRSVENITLQCDSCNTFGVYFFYLDCGGSFNYLWLILILAAAFVIIVVIFLAIIAFVMCYKKSHKNDSLLYSNS